MFAIMAEGPIDEIGRMQRELEAYICELAEPYAEQEVA